MIPILIALSGQSGVGKDTTADHLVNTYGFRKIAFADANREEVATNWSFDIRWFDAYPFKDTMSDRYCIGNSADPDFVEWYGATYEQYNNYIPRSPRQLQGLWSKYMKSLYGDDYYVDQFDNKIFESGRRNIVVPDVRTELEEKYLHDLRRGYDATFINITSSRGKNISYDGKLHDWSFAAPDLILANELSISEFNFTFEALLCKYNKSFESVCISRMRSLEDLSRKAKEITVKPESEKIYSASVVDTQAECHIQFPK